MTTRRKKEAEFEEAMEQLEEITRQLESGSLSLDESIRAYEKGMELKNLCQQMLERAERKLEYLARQQDGSIDREAIDFDENAEHESADQNRLFQGD